MKSKTTDVNVDERNQKHLFSTEKLVPLTEQSASVGVGGNGANICPLPQGSSDRFGCPAPRCSPESPHPPDQLRRLLAIVDSTLIQLCALPQDDELASGKNIEDLKLSSGGDALKLSSGEDALKLSSGEDALKLSSVGDALTDCGFKDNVARSVDDIVEPDSPLPVRWNYFQESINNIVSADSHDDLISFESLSVPIPPAVQHLETSQSCKDTQRCLICDDFEWSSADRPRDVIEPRKRSVTFAETANKGVSTEQKRPEAEIPLEEIDDVVHAILSSLSCSKATQAERKKKRSDFVAETLSNTLATKKAPPKVKRSKTEGALPKPRISPQQINASLSQPRTFPPQLRVTPPQPRASPPQPAVKRCFKKSKSSPPLPSAKPAPTTFSTFRESSISTRTRPNIFTFPSPREPCRIGDVRPLRDAPFLSRDSPSSSRKAKKGSGASLVMEPLMTVVRQIASSRSATSDDGDAVLVLTGSKLGASASTDGSSTSTVVCVQLAPKETQKVSAVVSTLLAGPDCVDAGTMTDFPVSAGKTTSVCGFNIAAGDCVLVVRSGMRPASSATSSASVIVSPKRKRPKKAYRMSTRSLSRNALAQRLLRRRSRKNWHRRRLRSSKTHSILRRNTLLTLCLSVLSLTFGSFSVSILSNPHE